uniref:polynucleotide adenylyltransferase n=1 Tax=Cacopsylla melanoneura TaxID=428564 RepID=A0A8D8V503_9HEMI
MSSRKRQFRDSRVMRDRDISEGNPFNKRRRRNPSQNPGYQVVRQELNFQSLLHQFNSLKNNSSSSTNNNRNIELMENCIELIDNHKTLPLHEGLMDLYETISPSPLDHAMRFSLIKDITRLVQNIWPQAVVEVFGSFCTGLYLPGGDIDLVVFGNWPRDFLKSKKVYYSLANALNKSHLIKKNSVQVIGFAKVPIVKFEDSRFHISFDVSFNEYGGLGGVVYLRKQLKEYPCLRILIMIIKQMLNEKKLNTVYRGGISSYSLYMMIISFIQRHPRVEVLRTNTEVNIAVLLIEFFDLYGCKFNYDSVCISVMDGTYKSRDAFYRQYGLAYPHRASICIQDPCALQNDIGRGSFCIPEIKLSFLKAKTQLIAILKKTL